jgi:carbonic anhydrase
MKIQQFFALVCIYLLANACDSNKTENQAEHSSEDELYTLPGLDHGLIQSPINILTSTLQDADEHEIEATTIHDDKVTAIVNKGHTIELEFEPGMEALFDGKNYEFKQAHFHTPSEHQVDGMTFPMEMHFVCLHKELDQEKPEYLVVAAFFKMGKENKFMSRFIEKIPKQENDTVSIADDPVYIDDLIGDINPDRKYYYYKGSLTTSPYTESVNWLILRDVIQASPEQIKIINDLEGNNARHVQAMFGREIEAN